MGVVWLWVALLAGCATESYTTSIRPLTVSSVDIKKTSLVVVAGEVSGTRYLLLTSLSLFPNAGMVAMCGGAHLYAAFDQAAAMREAFENRMSTLTLKRSGDPKAIVVSPGFIPVSYKGAAKTDASLSLAPWDLGDGQGACGVTDIPWHEQWDGRYSANLGLYAKPSRTQTVVGGNQ